MYIIFNTQIFNIHDDYNVFSNIMIGISIVTLPHVILVEITDIRIKSKASYRLMLFVVIQIGINRFPFDIKGL